MIRQTHSAARDVIVGKAIAPVVAELRLVEPADFIRLEQFAALDADRAGVEVSYVAFKDADADPERNTAFLARAIEESRIRPTVPAALNGA